MPHVATKDAKFKKVIVIRNSKQYFLVLLTNYCKKRHKREKGTPMCYYCEEFYLTFEQCNFNPYNLNNKDRNKYNRVINSDGLFFRLSHLRSHHKFHKNFEEIHW